VIATTLYGTAENHRGRKIMQEQERQASVEAALSQIVGDFGRKVSDDPVRLRNLLIDATGVDAMTLDAEIGAVVAAAETDVMTTLTSDDATVQAEATQRLTAVLGPERAGLAGWATEAWTSVLGATSSRPGAALGGATLDATALPGTVVGDDATALPSAMVTEDATVVPGPTTRLPGAPGDAAASDPSGESDQKNRVVLIGAFAGLIVLAIVVIALATRGGGGDGEAEPEPTSSSVVDDTGEGRDTSTTVPAGDTTPVTVADPSGQLTTPFVVAGGVTGERSLTPGDRSTTIDLTFTNASGSAFEGYWLEAAPAAFGRGPLDAQSPDVIAIGDAETPVLAVPLVLADGESTSVSYTTSWTPDDDGDLDSAAAGYDPALRGWVERNGDPRSPSVSMTSAASTTESSYTLTGVTEPTNTVTVDGRDVDVAADGSFGVPAELATGTTTFELAATSPLGVRATAPASVTFEPPPEPTTPVTDPPQNAAPVLLCNDDYVVFEGAFEGYIFGVPLDCFADPDGDVIVYYSDIGTGAPPDQCPTDQVCWVYRVPDGWDGTPFEITAKIWAEDPEGLQSAAGFLTMCLNCTP
jgi:hypothetical protein